MYTGGKGPGPSGNGLVKGDNNIGIVIATVQVIGPEIVQLTTRGGKVISSSFKPNPC